MRSYADPSVIVSAYGAEPGTELSIGLLRSLRPGELLVSWWTDTEVSSALGIKTRVGTITPAARLTVVAAIRRMFRESATLVVPLAEDFQTASAMMEGTAVPLRGGDALHLAIAKRAKATTWTLDRRMADAGQQIGLDVRLLA